MKLSKELMELANSIDGEDRGEWAIQQEIYRIADSASQLEEALDQIGKQVADRVSWHCGSMSVESEARRGRKVIHKIQDIIDSLKQ